MPQLSPAQLLVLKADMAANAASLNQPGWWAEEIANRWYNQPADPAWVVWRSSVTWDEIMLNGMDWARVDNLTVGKARIWDWLFRNAGNSMNPSKANIRSGIDSAWVGTAADLAVRAAVYGHCKRAATRIEKLLSTGLGTTESPATSAFSDGFRLTYQDVEAAQQAQA